MPNLGTLRRANGSCRSLGGSWTVGSTIVSIALVVRAGPDFASIGAVYTPPELRGRGYSAALCAELSRFLLSDASPLGAKARVTLFADRANATSNRLYQRLGYRPVGEQVHLTRIHLTHFQPTPQAFPPERGPA